MLAQEDAARYLLGRGLLGPEAVVDGDLGFGTSRAAIAISAWRRAMVSATCSAGAQPDAVHTVAQEASVYQRLAEVGDEIVPYVPRFRGYDAAARVLALELVRDAEDLRTFHVRTGRFSAGPAAALGRALGTLHRLTAQPQVLAPASAPWILWVHRPDARVFRDIGPAGLELIRIVQGATGFAQALERLREGWSTGALVHGDVKWDNCLVISRDDGGEEIRSSIGRRRRQVIHVGISVRHSVIIRASGCTRSRLLGWPHRSASRSWRHIRWTR